MFSEKFEYINLKKLVMEISRFISFVSYKDGTDKITFGDDNKFLGRHEKYKADISLRAKDFLRISIWKGEDIGSGKIAERVMKAVDISDNLMRYFVRTHFKNRIYENMREAEDILYDIYCGTNDEHAFKRAIHFFGGRYPLIAYLFFIKDSTRYLPISPENFDKIFKKLDINFKTSHFCSWSNYKGFCSIVEEVRQVLEELLPMEENASVRLIDAHSFLWVVMLGYSYFQWDPSPEEKNLIEKEAHKKYESILKKQEYTREYYLRNSEEALKAKRRANGVCQLCGEVLDFFDSNGMPYLEAHHIIWLSQNGMDHADNIAALCPNCHRRMHVLDDPEDIKKLQTAISSIGIVKK